MFEKEAEEYYEDVTVGTFQECTDNFADAVLTAYKDGAEFGYNKAKEEDKWHDLRKDPNDLPKHANRVFVFTDEGVGLGVYGLDNEKWYTYDTGFEVYAWKEIIPPKED